MTCPVNVNSYSAKKTHDLIQSQLPDHVPTGNYLKRVFTADIPCTENERYGRMQDCPEQHIAGFSRSGGIAADIFILVNIASVAALVVTNIYE